MNTFNNVIQPVDGDLFNRDHPIKGNWKKEIFRNENDITIELGCGRGEYTLGLAQRHPDRNFIGIGIKGARLWGGAKNCLLYTSDAADDLLCVDLGGRRIIKKKKQPLSCLRCTPDPPVLRFNYAPHLRTYSAFLTRP